MLNNFSKTAAAAATALIAWLQSRRRPPALRLTAAAVAVFT
jgi:hypothetical protein